MTLTDVQVSRLKAALDKQLEADKQFEEKTKAILNPPSPRLPSLPPRVALPPVSPSTIPGTFEDRYAKGWSDAWDLIGPQLYELHRQYAASANRRVKWLPIICFCCTLLGIALGWYGSNVLWDIRWTLGR